MARELFVVAGEASGDAMAARVARRLGVPCFGLGGPELDAAGVELVAHTSTTAAMGVTGVAPRLPAILAVAGRLAGAARARRPRAALLAGYTELNAWLGPRLRRQGTRVLWYGAPQIWAWRGGRAPRIRRACDRLATVLPFEEALWRGHGVDARYVGHPALENAVPARADVRARLGLDPRAQIIALLPGSRAHEVREHLDVMLGAARLSGRDARVVLAPALDRRTASRVRVRTREAGFDVVESSAPPVLPAFDVAIAASGTATLECALAGVPPLVVYQADALTAWVARRFVTTPHIGLPNIVLGERAFPEIAGRRLDAAVLATAVRTMLERGDPWARRTGEVRARLAAGRAGAESPSEVVAEMMAAWLT